MQIVGEDPPAGMVGDSYYTALNADASPPYQWTIIDNSLPAGLALDGQQGTISGTPQPEAQGTASFTVRLADAHGATTRRMSLVINPALKITRSIEPPRGGGDPDLIAELQAEGGAPPYTWAEASGSRLPDNLRLGHDSGQIIGVPARPGTTLFRVEATDRANHTASSDFRIRVHPAWRLGLGTRHAMVDRVSITVRPPSWLRQRFEALRHISNWLFAVLGLGIPSLGTIWIFVYAFGTHGPHLTYLSTAMLTGLAAFLSGCLAGFLFGIPKIVSSGQLRQEKGAAAPAYTPSSNLAEVSDWLTKLLLGAGLVQLTRLGAPIGGLIVHVSAGLYISLANRGAAEVLAGSILFGYAFAVSIRNSCDRVLASMDAVGCDTLACGAWFAAADAVCCAA